MSFELVVLAADSASEMKWAHHLKSVLEGLISVDVGIASGDLGSAPSAQILFIDSAIPNLDFVLENAPRGGKAIFLLHSEESPGARRPISELVARVESGKVDDVLVFPFRPIEVMSKLRHYHQILMWDEVTRLNASFQDLIGRLQSDLRLAEQLQKIRMPVRFPEVKGFKVASRYLAGMKSGGDHFDLAESKTGNQLSMVLTDSSSYGLSSAVLSVLMRVAVKLSAEDLRSCEETVRQIQDEILLTLSEKDRLGLFYGTLSRKDYRLRYLNLGTSCAFYAQPGREFAILPSQGPAISKSAPAQPVQAEIELQPEGRLVLVSDGFSEAVGGAEGILHILNRYRNADAFDAINEMVFAVKSGFAEPDDLPAQDCTALVFDVDARVLRQV